MMSEEATLRDYRVAFLGHLLHRNEQSLRRGYEFGRRAVIDQVSILELVNVHHQVFGRILADSPASETQAIVTSASEFFLEVLATYHMTQQATQPE